MEWFLFIDADDTLWENNIHFERAFEEFLAFLGHSRLTPSEIRGVLDEIEIANNRVHGYGALNFARNLSQCYERLAEREVKAADWDAVRGFAERILEQPVEPLEGVPETLAYLSARRDLTLLTKGHPEEQRLKIDRSGLGKYFGRAVILKEKDAAAYRGLVEERRLDPERCWMIGNSPKSDINPALAAGMNAVWVPHARTWTLEREDIRPGRGRLLTVERFADLRRHF